MYTEKLGCFSLLSRRASWMQHRADSRGARLLVIHLYTAFPQPAVYIRRNSSSFPRLAAPRGPAAIPIRCIFFTARSSFYHRFRFRFPVFFPDYIALADLSKSENRWRIDGGVSHGYPIVHPAYDNLDGKFARGNVCCNLKSLYHAFSSSRVYVTCNLIFYFILTRSDRVNSERYKRVRPF